VLLLVSAWSGWLNGHDLQAVKQVYTPGIADRQSERETHKHKQCGARGTVRDSRDATRPLRLFHERPDITNLCLHLLLFFL
jgi:hypothetical protein